MVTACVWLGGCGSQVIARERPAWIGAQGQGWQLVMASPEATLAAGDRPELSRLDASLGRRPVDGLDALLYPPTDRPTLERERRLFLDRDAQRPTIYLPPRRPHRR